MFKNFPDYNKRLRDAMGRLGVEVPDLMAGFIALHKAAVQEGVLSTRVKELIALAIAITVRCDGCIAFHVYDAVEAGATRNEILETIGMAILMGGGPSMVYGIEALEALNQFKKAEVTQEV